MNLTIEDLAVVERVKKEVVREVTQEMDRLLASRLSQLTQTHQGDASLAIADPLGSVLGLEAARVQAASAVLAAFLGSGAGAPSSAAHDAVWAASEYLKAALGEGAEEVRERARMAREVRQ